MNSALITNEMSGEEGGRGSLFILPCMRFKIRETESLGTSQ